MGAEYFIHVFYKIVLQIIPKPLCFKISVKTDVGKALKNAKSHKALKKIFSFTYIKFSKNVFLSYIRMFFASNTLIEPSLH